MGKQKKEQLFEVVKSNKYRGSIRPVLGGNKKRSIEFGKGNAVKVTSEELEVITKLKWGTEVPKKKED